MKIFIAYGFDLESHGLIGAAKSQEGMDEQTAKYKKDHTGSLPYVIVREIELKD